jgi:hypothetical protein
MVMQATRAVRRAMRVYAGQDESIDPRVQGATTQSAGEIGIDAVLENNR